jgi:uncharacterized protein with von Willebrand factor type A (vWA) domain
VLLIDEIDRADEEFEARLIASRSDALSRTDLRTLVSPEEAAEAERIAERLARAIRYRLTRRGTPARRGEMIDRRRTIRRNLSRGGEPIELRRKHRPERPVKLVVLLDASAGSTRCLGGRVTRRWRAPWRSRSITSTALRPPTRWRAWHLSRTSSRVSD